MLEHALHSAGVGLITFSVFIELNLTRYAQSMVEILLAAL